MIFYSVQTFKVFFFLFYVFHFNLKSGKQSLAYSQIWKLIVHNQNNHFLILICKSISAFISSAEVEVEYTQVFDCEWLHDVKLYNADLWRTNMWQLSPVACKRGPRQFMCSLFLRKKCEQHADMYPGLCAGAVGTWSCNQWDAFSLAYKLSNGWKADVKWPDISRIEVVEELIIGYKPW